MHELITSPDGVFFARVLPSTKDSVTNITYVKMQELITFFAANGIIQNDLNRMQVFS